MYGGSYLWCDYPYVFPNAYCSIISQERLEKHKSLKKKIQNILTCLVPGYRAGAPEGAFPPSVHNCGEGADQCPPPARWDLSPALQVPRDDLFRPKREATWGMWAQVARPGPAFGFDKPHKASHMLWSVEEVQFHVYWRCIFCTWLLG